MSCNYAEKVSLLIDGELPASQTREVELHLVQCVECQTARLDFLNLRNQIAAYTASVGPFVQQQRLATILANSKPPHENRPANRSWFGFPFKLRPAAFAFASLLLIGLLIGAFVYRNSLRQKSGSMSARNGAVSFPAAEENAANRTAPVQRESRTPPGKKSPRKLPNPKPDKVRKDQRVVIPPDPFVARNPAASSSSAPLVRAADAETLTAMHFEKSELLLRTFRNVRVSEPGESADVRYERSKAQELVYQNMMLRREADAAGDVQVASLLENLEPILIDIANLPDNANADDIRVINDRVERKNIVALLQVNSTALARALD